MGTVNVDVSTDGGATWTNEWTLSGNQRCLESSFVSLSGYTGQSFGKSSALTGTSFTSDMARFTTVYELSTTGCTDPFR